MGGLVSTLCVVYDVVWMRAAVRRCELESDSGCFLGPRRLRVWSVAHSGWGVAQLGGPGSGGPSHLINANSGVQWGGAGGVGRVGDRAPWARLAAALLRFGGCVR